MGASTRKSFMEFLRVVIVVEVLGEAGFGMHVDDTSSSSSNSPAVCLDPQYSRALDLFLGQALVLLAIVAHRRTVQTTSY
jgi:hypothetical protein